MRKEEPEETRRQLERFFISNPHAVNTARQIARRTGISLAEVERVLGTMAAENFVQRIQYPGVNIYRYIPPRREAK